MGTSKKNEEEKRRGLDKRTPAQAAFEKMQEKRVRLVGLPAWMRGQRPETQTVSAPGTPAGGRAIRRDLNLGEKMMREREEEPRARAPARTRSPAGPSGPQRGELEAALKGAQRWRAGFAFQRHPLFAECH